MQYLVHYSYRTFFFSAHANTLRGLVKTIDRISDENIQNIAIPTVSQMENSGYMHQSRS